MCTRADHLPTTQRETRVSHKLSQTRKTITGGAASSTAASTCKRSGQLAPSARQRAACRAYSLRRLDEDEDGGLDELSDELRRNRGASAAGDDQVHHGARAQRTSSSFPDSFSHLIIMAAALTSSSNLLTGSRWGVRRRGAGSWVDGRIRSGECSPRVIRTLRSRWACSSLRQPSPSHRT